MSRFGFVTPNDPPRAPEPQNHAKTSRAILPDQKNARKIPKAAGPFFFQN
jgi:hypothetical protein